MDTGHFLIDPGQDVEDVTFSPSLLPPQPARNSFCSNNAIWLLLSDKEISLVDKDELLTQMD